jgi:hypothetical protein
MSNEDERDFEPSYEGRDPDYDWREYGDHESRVEHLEGKDYLALFIASLQTIFLPLVILAVVLLAIGLFVGIFF